MILVGHINMFQENSKKAYQSTEKNKLSPGEMIPQLRALGIVAEGQDSSPSTHRVAYNCLQL